MKILLVDDDPGVLQALLAILKQNEGHQITIGTNGPLAIENAESAGGVDLLITDVVMEPTDGFTLRQQLQAIYPAMKTLFISGYDLSGYAAQTEGCEVLAKPIAAETLLAAVAQIEPLVPKPQAVARPRVVARPKVVAQPVAIPAAAPGTPTATAVPTVSAAVPPLETTEEEIFGSDDLLNKRVGNYNIVWKIGEDEWGPVYVAVQTSMARPVAMKVLSEERQRTDPTAKEHFIATARAKAAVKHPSILSVYEAGEASGHSYYTYEYVDGMHLAEAKEQGRTLDDPLVLGLIKTVAEGCAYLHHHKIAHSPLEAHRIYLGKDNRPHLSNLAVLGSGEQPEIQKDIHELAGAVTDLLPNGIARDPGLQALLTRMETEGPSGFLSWTALQQAAKALEPKVIPADAIKLTAQERAAIRAVEEAKRQQKRTLLFSTVGIFVFLWVAGTVLYFKFRSNERQFNDMVRIPAGEFVYQDGKTASTGEFYIDKYEVTIGQYARFLAYLDANPTQDGKPDDEFDHPNQPKGKSHIPGSGQTEWEIYLGRARAGLPAGFVPIDLNCPIFNVDFWDAYAYARWANKRLPTEQEWEKAARGLKGQAYPWGDKFDPKGRKVNYGADYDPKPNPHSAGKVDGYFWWCPVDAMSSDSSPFGVVGMAGNVSEWTTDESGKTAVIRGGNFHNPKVSLTNRVTEPDAYPETMLPYLGFRCASDKPPVP